MKMKKYQKRGEVKEQLKPTTYNELLKTKLTYPLSVKNSSDSTAYKGGFGHGLGIDGGGKMGITNNLNYQKGLNAALKIPKRQDLMRMGGAAKVVKRYAKYGKEFKDIPAGNKGLVKLPTAVRNNMGYAKRGKEIKDYYGGGSNMAPSMDKKGRRIPGMFDR